MGDSRDSNGKHRQILNHIAKTYAIFAINTGDIVSRGNKWEYDNFIKEISDFPLPYFVAVGNHEVAARNGQKYFQEYINPLSYSFSLGEFAFIIVDNSLGKIGAHQFEWMENLLSSKKDKYVFMHNPSYSPALRFSGNVMDSIDEMKKFMKTMEKYKTNIVFAGHIHGLANRFSTESPTS
ncbi:MAG: metallophosphoesterase family protein [Vulcanimicrobiota bacterium]